MKAHDRSVGRYISVLYRQAQAYISHQMKPYQIGSGQYSFLLTLFNCDGMSQEELSCHLMIDKGTTARAMEKLEKAGYVVRKRNTEDRRAYHVFLTDKAREIKPVLHQTLNAWTDRLVADLDGQEKEMVYVILGKMVHSVRHEEEAQGDSPEGNGEME